MAIAQLGWLKLCFFVIPQTWGLISPFPWTDGICMVFEFVSTRKFFVSTRNKILHN